MQWTKRPFTVGDLRAILKNSLSELQDTQQELHNVKTEHRQQLTELERNGSEQASFCFLPVSLCSSCAITVLSLSHCALAVLSLSHCALPVLSCSRYVVTLQFDILTLHWLFDAFTMRFNALTMH